MGAGKRRIIPSLLIIAVLLCGFVSAFAVRNAIAWKRLERFEDEICAMARLVTARQVYREVIYSEKKILISEKRVLFSVLFTVDAGFDLKKCRMERDWMGGVVIFLPPPEIFSIDCDETSINQYIAKEQFSTIRYSDYAEIIGEEKGRIREEASRSDLMIRAEDNARALLEEMLRSVRLGHVSIRFSEVPGWNGRLFVSGANENG